MWQGCERRLCPVRNRQRPIAEILHFFCFTLFRTQNRYELLPELRWPVCNPQFWRPSITPSASVARERKKTAVIVRQRKKLRQGIANDHTANTIQLEHRPIIASIARND